MTWPDYAFNFPVGQRESVPRRAAHATSRPHGHIHGRARPAGDPAALQRHLPGEARRPRLCRQCRVEPGSRRSNGRHPGRFRPGQRERTRGKFLAAHSSSALAANTFGPGGKKSATAVPDGKPGARGPPIRKAVPHRSRRHPLPPTSTCWSTVPALSSASNPSSSNSFCRPGSPLHARKPALMEECWATDGDVERRPVADLDAAQLVRHYLGLRNQPEFQDKRIVLLYLFWEPENWADFPEYRRHREESSVVTTIHVKDPMSPTWMTYPDLWRLWEYLGLYPDHLRENCRRYLLAIHSPRPRQPPRPRLRSHGLLVFRTGLCFVVLHPLRRHSNGWHKQFRHCLVFVKALRFIRISKRGYILEKALT